ncbi:pyruvate dehydrogenase complex dihydrolipoamide acetyltransferase [Mariluticola halotolerans]|uniref:pyruvate dehydrogenase complex dihydrolipoamide acetyltransferase n=1 Tax=Mariluticola halotolerans TaxID=2909283 RepID=UPI0026E18BE6|nr:pyruvate dehydrogenase complex dihydrolipoamide acetyltransferase [Mariluticola halotolerans]UJQ94986.1 pyruvate dehydrogenase complex dihydrolipoamide acetyltransferase [Mariluticola halotolerans]
MSINITMPALSPTMEEGTLAKWHVKEGDSVSSGDVIAEIETDKATMEVEAVDEGTIGKILVAEGSEGVKVNAVIAVLLEEGESAEDAAKAVPAPEPKAKPAEETEKPAPKAAPAKAEPAAAQPAAAKAETASKDGTRVFASPLARRLAREANIDVAALTGSGPKGRVVKADVEKAKKEGVPSKGAASATLAKGMGGDAVRALYEEGSYEVVPNDGMRKTVAARLTEAKQTVPHFYLTLDCQIDALLTARAEINEAAPKNKEGKPSYKLSVNDFIVKAWAIALQRVPAANATWAGDAILLHKASDVAVAVAVPGGLFTPVVRSAESKTLRQISDEVRDYAIRAKSKKLAPHEYQGGSTAVSNLGMFGIKDFAAVINPPHGTILAVGVGEERVYPDKGEIKIGNFMSVTLSCDHRSVDGALGAELLGVFKQLIEQPVMMLA